MRRQTVTINWSAELPLAREDKIWMNIPIGPIDGPAGMAAAAFARAFVAGNYDEAWFMLSASLQIAVSPAELKEQYSPMIAYGDGPTASLEVMQVLE